MTIDQTIDKISATHERGLPLLLLRWGAARRAHKDRGFLLAELRYARDYVKHLKLMIEDGLIVTDGES